MGKPAAVHFEAKKHAYRQTQDGVVISFVVHPNDVNPEIAAAPLGTQYIVALAPYVEKEEESSQAKSDQTGGGRARTRAAMLCGDKIFQAWILGTGRVGYADDEKSAAGALRVRCDIRSRSEIATDPEALQRFLTMETEYMMDTGRMARPR